MKLISCLIIAVAALTAVEASAQSINLTGKYRCIAVCRADLPGPAFVTQNEWDLNLLNEAGQSSRAWRDWSTPNRIWIESWGEGAVFSPDGMTIQFDRGTVWQREPVIDPAVAYCMQHYRTYDQTTQTYLGFDRRRHRCP